MAKDWFTPKAKKLLDEYDELSRALFSQLPPPAQPAFTSLGLLGGLGQIPASKTFEQWQNEESERRLRLVADTAMYKRIAKSVGYREARMALDTRFANTRKKSEYRRPHAEISLLKAIALDLHFFELNAEIGSEQKYPTATELDSLIGSVEKTLRLMRECSGVLMLTANYGATIELATTLEQLKAIRNGFVKNGHRVGYVKPHDKALSREREFARTIAPKLFDAFGECAPIVFSAVCSIVNYNVSNSALSKLANDAIKTRSVVLEKLPTRHFARKIARIGGDTKPA